MRINTSMRLSAVLIWVNICLFFPACSREPRPVGRPAPRAEAPARPVEPATPAPSPSPAPYPSADSIDWQGDPGFPNQVPDPPRELTLADGDHIRYQIPKERGPAILERVGPDGSLRWQTLTRDLFVPGAALLVLDQRVYVAEHGRISSGATLSAFDLASGGQLWSLPVHGLGPIGHSKYANRVELAAIQGAIVVFGNESSGRYIEVFAPDGSMLSTRVVPR